MKPLDFNLLSALDALLRTNSVSAAAQQMHLSTPAMSHTLARIRDALGDPILVRAGRKLTPTPHAMALREPVRRLVAEARELMQPGTAKKLADIQREFVVRGPEGMGIIYGVSLLAALQQSMPLATLRFVPESDSDALALREGRIDLDVSSSTSHLPEIMTSVLYEHRIVAAVKAGHALLGKGSPARPARLERFLAEAHVAIAKRGNDPDPVDVALKAVGANRRIVLTLPSAYGALMAAARSDMVACVPESLALGVAAGLRLVTFELPLPVPPIQVVQAWHPQMNLDPGHQFLRQCVSDFAPNVLAVPDDTPIKMKRELRHMALLRLGPQDGKRSSKPADKR